MLISEEMPQEYWEKMCFLNLNLHCVLDQSAFLYLQLVFMSLWVHRKKILSHCGVFGNPSSTWKQMVQILWLTVPTTLTDSVLLLPGPGGRSVSTSDGCSRPRAQRWRPGHSGRWFTAEEAPSPEGHTTTLTSTVRTAEERQPDLSQPPPGESHLRKPQEYQKLKIIQKHRQQILLQYINLILIDCVFNFCWSQCHTSIGL